MHRKQFIRLVEEALDSLPAEFRRRMHNLAVLVEDRPPGSSPANGRLLLGIFHGVPATHKSVWQLATGPDHIVLYQKNIEAVCRSRDDICRQVRLTLIHELGHYFGMTEEQLRDV